MASLAALFLAALPLHAQDTCGPEAPPPVPLCSVGGMLEAVNPSQTPDVFGNLNPAAFAGGANADLMPGQASLSLSGGVSAGGAACARHLAAKRIGGTDGVPGLDQGTVDMIESMSGEDFDIPTASGGTRRAVFEIFSPNIISYQGGGLGRPLSYRHGGVGGWPRNSGASLVIALTDAGPGDLRAGQSYDARAVSGDGDGDAHSLYSAWTGQIRPRPYPPPNDEKHRREQEFEKRKCRKLRKGSLELLELSTIPLDSTIGRETRDHDCDMDGVGQAGTRTTVPRGALTGKVHIERITETSVIGRFDLSGTARVNRERRTWSSRGPGRVDIADRDRGDHPMSITGRFAAPNMRNMGFARAPLEVAQAPVDAAAPMEELRLVSHRPRRNENNVPWEAPGIRLTFDRPLDPITITPAAVKLETGLAAGQGGGFMDKTKLHRGPYPASVIPAAVQGETGLANGQGGAVMERIDLDRLLQPASLTPTEVQLETGPPAGQGGVVMEQTPIQIRLSGPNTIIVTPIGPLRDGVRYRVTLTAGANGILGAEGESLAVDRVWGFDTMVDLDDNEIVSEGLAQHLEWREGVESDTIQVSTNAPLVRDKPAGIRVYAKWRADPQIAPGWHVLGFDAHVRVRPLLPPQAPLIVPEHRGVEIRRPDMYTAEERRKAENSVNLFGWTPDFKEAVALRTEIEPVRDCDTAPRVFSGVEELDWDPLDRDLNLGYVFARVGPWYDFVPQDALEEAALTVDRSEDYIEQLFPVQSVAFSEAPAPPPDPDFNEKLVSAIEKIQQFERLAEKYSDDTMDILRGLNDYLSSPLAVTEKLRKRRVVRTEIMNVVQDHLIANNSYDRFDLVVIFMPHEWIKLLGVTTIPLVDEADNPTKAAAQPFIGMSLTKALTGVKRIANNGAIAHEVGHAFGLSHKPGVPPQRSSASVSDMHEGTRWEGIEGMRIAPDGQSGQNKSYEDGNAETGEELLPLMFPRVQPKENQFISQENYLLMLRNLKKDFAALSP